MANKYFLKDCLAKFFLFIIFLSILRYDYSTLLKADKEPIVNMTKTNFLTWCYLTPQSYKWSKDVWVLTQRNRKDVKKFTLRLVGGKGEGFLQMLICLVPVVPTSLSQILSQILELETRIFSLTSETSIWMSCFTLFKWHCRELYSSLSWLK